MDYVTKDEGRKIVSIIASQGEEIEKLKKANKKLSFQIRNLISARKPNNVSSISLTCVSPTKTLTLGKTYKSYYESEDCYFVVNDNGFYVRVLKTRFIII